VLGPQRLGEGFGLKPRELAVPCTSIRSPVPVATTFMSVSAATSST
jgi:hypothetical protein